MLAHDATQVEIVQTVEQRQLLIDAEVIRIDAGLGEGAHDFALPVDRRCLGRIIGDQHRDLGEPALHIQAIGVASALLQQAVEAVAQMPWTVCHRDDDHEVVAPVVATRRDQGLQFAECRLVRRQHARIEAPAPHRRLQRRDPRVLCGDLRRSVGVSGRTGRWGRHACPAGPRSG